MELNELKSFLSRFNIKPKKKLGQNFLLSDDALSQIMDAAELKPTDTILEIGPGLGALTSKLAVRAGLVLAVEKDRKLVAVLRKLLKSRKNVKIIYGDALDIGLQKSEVRGQNSDNRSQTSVLRHPTSELRLPQSEYKVVANIPYYLTGKLLQNFLSPKYSPPHEGELEGVIENKATMTSPSPSSRGGGYSRPSLIVLLLQKEVAERIVARPGKMSILSVSVQLYGEPEIVDFVPKENFYPVPEVDSAIVRIRVFDRPRLQVNDKKFMQLVKIGFSHKRKMLANNLKGFGLQKSEVRGQNSDSRGQTSAIRHPSSELRLPKSDWKKVLRGLNIPPNARAQDLSLDQWKAIYDLTFS